MHSIHMDETFWVDPEVFRPERHIDKNGCIIQTDKILPFGAGSQTKNTCLNVIFELRFVLLQESEVVWESLLHEPRISFSPRHL